MTSIEYPYLVRLPKYIGPAIKVARKKKNWTQKDLADYTATSVKFVSNVEQGKASAQLDKVLDLIRAVGLKVYLTDQEM
ncbi:MAG: helix-turn-helix domain-containing protein [Desulfopila sp.]